jgi:hypothetical protein
LRYAALSGGTVFFRSAVEAAVKGDSMCRSIKQLRNSEIPATEEEIRLAALQFVRKVSGYRKPSRVNEAAFERAVQEVAEATQKLINSLTVKSA